MNITHLFAAPVLAAAAAFFPAHTDALAVPEIYQPLVAIFWLPAETPALARIIECESGWDRFAVGAAGELGLTQILPSTWEDTNDRLGSDVPISYWSSPAANLYQARAIHQERGWSAWSCSARG